MNINYQKILIYIVIIILACLLTVFTFDTWQTVLMVALLLILISYIFILAIDRLSTNEYVMRETNEGFTGAMTNAATNAATNASTNAATNAETSKYEWLSNEDLFDDFYASVFTKLTQNENLIQAETAICMEEFTKTTPKDQLIVLDAGCGIGIGTAAFAKQGAGTVVGIDRSHAMIRYAKGTTLPSTTLNDLQKQNVEFRTFDLMGAGAAPAAEFTDACLLYFTVYYFKDLDTLFRNMALWVKPGGNLAIEVVNKYKFEPILDSSNPWVGFSPQKYSKERITKSKVAFDKFDYEAEFDLEDPKAEFRETFRFKDGSIRRQKHTLYMPSMPDIIKKAQNNGWLYTKYVDLMPLQFSYGFLLFFKRASE